MSSPLIKVLRNRYPDAHIAWLVQSEAQELLAANPFLNEVIIWPRAEWKRMWRERRWLMLIHAVRGFIKQLRARHFDLVIDAQGLLKSAVWAWLSGARQRIGLGSREGSTHLMTRVIDKPDEDPRIGSEYRHLVQALGLDPGDFYMDITLTEDDHRFAEELIDRNALDKGYIVVCPFTTRPQKHWIECNWPILAQRINTGFSKKTLVLGGPGDQEAGQRVTAMNSEMVNMTGKTRLRQAAALISRADLLIGVDTGLTHLGIAFNIPTITLFGSTCPYLDTGRDNTIILYKQLECSPCRRKPTCNGAFTCMTSITVDEVMENAARLIGQVS